MEADNTYVNYTSIRETRIKQDRRWNAEQPSATLDP